MRIKSVEITNFRCFEKLKLNLHEQFTLLIGTNGAGKSTILDALAIGMGSFFLGMEGGIASGIHQDDVRYITYELGSRMVKQVQYPAEITCAGEVFAQTLSWSRSLNGEGNKTTYGNASEISRVSKEKALDIRRGNTFILLPVLSYYGTGRLWAKKREKRKTTRVDLMTRTAGYADCLDAMSNDKLMYKWFEQMTYQELQEGKPVPELTAVKKALLMCFNGPGETTELGSAERCSFNVKTAQLEIVYIKPDGSRAVHALHEMSDGYRNMLSMVADIAYRMAVLNPQLLDRVTEETEGIVLIDEIDLHLHPSWQRRVVADLCRIFPKVQFIATTHAPSVISSVSNEKLIILEENAAHVPSYPTYGKDANAVLRRIMDVPERPDDVRKKMDDFSAQMSREDYRAAENTLRELREILGDDDPEIVGAQTSLDLEMME